MYSFLPLAVHLLIQSMWIMTFYFFYPTPLAPYFRVLTLLPHFLSQLELLLVVEKLQELRSIRIQKLKKQGIYKKITLLLVSCDYIAYYDSIPFIGLLGFV